MTCYNPRFAWQLKVPNAAGKTPLQFNNPNSAAYKQIMVPCGACFGCQLDKSRDWAVRIMHEARYHKCTSFITLTYAKNPWSLNKVDFKNFMKRLRKQLDKQGIRIRFFQSAEYGSKLGRPHHHAIIFGHDFPDKTIRKMRGEYKVYNSDFLKKTWGHGRVEVGTLTIKSAQYVAAYLTKKRKDRRWYKGRMPEYGTMSRMPGIGKKWLDDYESDCYPQDICYVNPQWRCKPPKYYDYLLSKKNKAMYQKVKLARAKKLENARAEDYRMERMIQKKHCKITKIMLYSERTYENENIEAEGEM